MASYTKIIDLFGLPACGKTTLCNYICNNYNGQLKIATLQTALSEIPNINLWKIIFSISFKLLIASLLVQLVTVLDKRHKKTLWFSWYKHAIFYNYVKKYSDYDVIFVDHGDIQSFVSIEHGENLHDNILFTKVCLIYMKWSKATMYICCDISPENAYTRMTIRKRYTHGRIDKMVNDSMRYIALQEEKLRFDFFVNLMKLNNMNYKVLDMTLPVLKLNDEVLSYIDN